MSYLGPLRLHFAGRFQAATSSVNNDPTHFDNSTFLDSFQDLQGPNGDPPNGWFDPRGDADFRLIGCRVTAAFLADGSPAPANDLVRELLIADSDRAAPAKIADLDPCQQMVSMLFGLEVRITDTAGVARFRGAYEPAAFFDIWARAPGPFSDPAACAYYQSVLTALEWGDITSSPFLTALRDASPDRLLSIKFMVDGYNATFGDAEFTRGRIVGTIGPGSSTEPRHLVRGRQFVLPADPTNTVNVNFCVGAVDAATSKLYLDLGNALPTKCPGGDIDSDSIGELKVFIGQDYEALCRVPYQSSSWYEQTAGIVALPADRALTAAELERMATKPMSLSCAGQTTPALVEAAVYVRPDQLVFRCDPGEAATVRLYATKLGRPHAGATIRLAQDSGGLQPPSSAAGSYQAYPASWTVGTPASAVSFPPTVTTDGDGVAVVTIATSDPGNPRFYVDGQVYGISATPADGDGIPADPWNFISLLVWSGFQADDPPTWHGSLQPVFQQYANLYPIMRDFLDLSCYDDVCAHREMLLLAFGLPAEDANSMPVTRDLSSAKRAAILRWLSSLDEDGKPLLGTAPPAKPVEARPAAVAGVAGEQLLGGKGAAFCRMLSRKAKP
jgi:hypothetical protein